MTKKQQIGSILVVFAVAFLWIAGFNMLLPGIQKSSPTGTTMPRFSRTPDINEAKNLILREIVGFRLPWTLNKAPGIQLSLDSSNDWWSCEYIAELPGTCVFRV